jgi:hypothetical protein
MPLDARKYLYDIQQALALLTTFTAGKGIRGLRGGPDATCRSGAAVEIAGEALSQLARIDAALAANQ